MSNGNEKFVIQAVFDGSNAVKQAGQAANDINQQFGGKDLTGGLGGKFGAVTDILGELGPAATAAASVMATAFAGVSAAMDFADKINGIREMSAAAGMMPQQFEATAKALQMTGWSAEEASDKLKDINERFGEFRTTGTGALADVMKSWNIMASDLTSKDPIENLNTIVRKMKEQGATAEQIHFAMGEIVDDGQVLSQVLGENYNQYQKTKDAAMATSKATSENVEAAKEFKKHSAELNSAWEALTGTIGSSMLPYLDSAVSKTAQFLNLLVDGINKIRQAKEAAANSDTNGGQNRQNYNYGRPGYGNEQADKNKWGGSKWAVSQPEYDSDGNKSNPYARPGQQEFYGETPIPIRIDELRSQSQSMTKFNRSEPLRIANENEANRKGVRINELSREAESLDVQMANAQRDGKKIVQAQLKRKQDMNKAEQSFLQTGNKKLYDETVKSISNHDYNDDFKEKGAGSKGKANPIDEANKVLAVGIQRNKELLASKQIDEEEYAERVTKLTKDRDDKIAEINEKALGVTKQNTEERKKLQTGYAAFMADKTTSSEGDYQRQLSILKQKQEEDLAQLEEYIKKLNLKGDEAQTARSKLFNYQQKQRSELTSERLGIKGYQEEQRKQKENNHMVGAAGDGLSSMFGFIGEVGDTAGSTLAGTLDAINPFSDNIATDAYQRWTKGAKIVGRDVIYEGGINKLNKVLSDDNQINPNNITNDPMEGRQAQEREDLEAERQAMLAEEEARYQEEMAKNAGRDAEREAARKKYQENISNIDKTYSDMRASLEEKQDREKINRANTMFNTIIGLSKMFGEKGAKVAKAAMIAQSLYSQKTVIAKSWEALGSAAAMPFPSNIWAVAKAAADFVPIIAGASAAVTGARSAPDGQFHDGIDNVPKTGTYLLEGGERVVDKRLNHDLKSYINSGSQKSSSAPSMSVQAGITIQGDVTGDIEDKMHEWLERNKENVTGVVNEQMGRLGYR